jgi:hypothetical protein
MTTLRKIVGKTRLVHVTNRDIRQQCGIQPVGERILKRREEWDNNISRITEDRFVRIVGDNISKGTISPGIPNKR